MRNIIEDMKKQELEESQIKETLHKLIEDLQLEKGKILLAQKKGTYKFGDSNQLSISDCDEFIIERALEILALENADNPKKLLEIICFHRCAYQGIRLLNEAILKKDNKGIKKYVKMFDDVDVSLLDLIFEDAKDLRCL